MKFKKLTERQITLRLKRLKPFEKLIRRLKFNLNSLKKHGFHPKYHDGCSGDPIFIHKKLKVVIKQPYLCHDELSVPELGIPTIFIHIERVRYLFSR